MQIGELFVALGLEVDDKKLDAFQGKIDKTKQRMTTFIVAATAAAAAITAISQSAINATVSMTNFNLQTGLSIDKLQQWQKVAQLSDVTLSAEQVTQSIAGLQSQLTQIRLGGGNVTPFQLLGINTFGKDAFQVLEEIRGALVGIDNATATNLLQQIGLTPSFINILRLSRTEFEAINKEFFLNNAQRQGITKLGTSFTRLGIQLSAIKDNIVAEFAPALNKLLADITKWFSGNGKQVIKDMGNIVKIMIDIAQVLSNTIGLVYNITSAFLNFKGVVQTLLPILAVMAAYFFPIEAAIAGLLLLLDDIAVFLRGGDSLIGRALSDIKKIGEAIGSIFGFGGFGGLGGIDSEINILPPLPAVATSGSNTQNNNININSTAPAAQLADELQFKLNDANLQLNNGFM